MQRMYKIDPKTTPTARGLAMAIFKGRTAIVRIPFEWPVTTYIPFLAHTTKKPLHGLATVSPPPPPPPKKKEEKKKKNSFLLPLEKIICG